jgi:hypothetical protein
MPLFDINMSNVFAVDVPNNLFVFMIVKYWNLVFFSDFFDFWWIGRWYQSKERTSMIDFSVFRIYIIHHFIFTKATVQFGKFLFKNKADRNLPRSTFLYFYRKKWSLCGWYRLLSVENNVVFTLLRFFNDDWWIWSLSCIMSIKSCSLIIFIYLESKIIAILYQNIIAFNFFGELINR